MCGKIRQRFLDRDRQLRKLFEVLVVRCPLLHLLPQVCNRIVIRRIRWQGLCRNAVAMGCQKRLGRCTGVIPSTLMDQKQMLRGWRHDQLQECLVMLRVEPTCKALIEWASRAILNGSKDLI